MKKICLTLVLVVCLLVVSACGKNSLVGSWTYQTGSYTYTLNEDGTGDYNGAKFTYTTVSDKLSILYDGNTVPFETTYTIKGDKLNIKDSYGNDTIYVKK